MSYAITSDRGKNIAAGLTVGGTYNASDGSTWTKQADGSVSVKHNGVTTQNAYTPASGVGNSVSYASAAKSGGEGYTLGTKAGADAYNSVLQTGKSTQLSDGTVLVKGADGKVYAERKGGGVLGTQVTYSENDGRVSALEGLYAPGANNVYSQAQKQQEAATNAAVQKAVGDLEQQKKNTNLSYSNMFRQLYLNRMNAAKNLDQKMAAQGVTGGASETSRLGLSTSYAEALRQGEIDRMNAQKDLDKAITDTRLTGDISIAESAAKNAIDGANSYAGVLQSLISREDALNQYNQNREDTLAQQNKADAQALAYEMLAQGTMPSDDVLQAAGISKADAQTMVNVFAQNKAEGAAKENKSYAQILAEQMLQGGEMPPDDILTAAGLSKEAATVLQKAYKPEKGYTDQQGMYAAYAALAGDTSDATRTIVETYFGLPLETVLTALNYGEAE